MRQSINDLKSWAIRISCLLTNGGHEYMSTYDRDSDGNVIRVRQTCLCGASTKGWDLRQHQLDAEKW